MTEAATRMRDEIRELAFDIPSRAAEIEAARRMPLDLVNKLKSIVCSYREATVGWS
jgi:hypothetical protein